MIDPKSDTAKSTNDLFDSFKKFCKDIEKEMPKEEKKRAGAASRGGKPGAGAGLNPSQMAEMMSKVKKTQ